MYKNILIALSDSEAAERALHRAIALAEISDGDLFVVVVDEGLSIFESLVWAAADNLRVAATNAVECAETMTPTRPRGKIQ